jgi:hypothetical protein
MATATTTNKTVKVSAKKKDATILRVVGIIPALNENGMATFEALDNTSKVEQLKAVVSKPNVVPAKSDIPASTPSHLNPRTKDCAIPTDWKAMQKLAKEWGIKAGGKGVTSCTLNTWLSDYEKLGAAGFAAKHPDAVKRTETTKGSASPTVSSHDAFKGLSFRESQALVKSKGWKLEGTKATSWAGLNAIAAHNAK